MEPRPPPPPGVLSSPDGLNLAAGYLFVPAQRDFEEVAQDEVEDGLASAADTQAQLWVEAAQTGTDRMFKAREIACFVLRALIRSGGSKDC